jgi:hypothetical protein
MNTPALVLWSEGPYKKWRSRGRRHVHVLAELSEKLVPVDRVWQELQPFLHAKAGDVDSLMADMFEQPPELGS